MLLKCYEKTMDHLCLHRKYDTNLVSKILAGSPKNAFALVLFVVCITAGVALALVQWVQLHQRFIGKVMLRHCFCTHSSKGQKNNGMFKENAHTG